jgi:hypothetical protein
MNNLNVNDVNDKALKYPKNSKKNNKTNFDGYLYVRINEWLAIYNALKLGKTKLSLPDRENGYITGEVKRGCFIMAFEVEDVDDIEIKLQKEFRELNVKFDGGKEFFKNEIITLIEPYLQKCGIKYKKLSEEEISKMVRLHRARKNFKSIIKNLKIERMKKQHIWIERDYQTDIINFSKNELLSKNKLYIELATGGGKSNIVYNLFEYLKSEFIIIISPRKIINSQNISEKYLQILKDNYKIFNCSEDNNFDEYLKLSNKKIVICCINSINKIYDKVLSFSITNITIWFDEAHWGIEEWIDGLNDDINSQFWLLNNSHIKYRIFTSASPNKEKILQNENIFGKLYSAIKVKKLIDLNWLAGIKPYVYSENEKNVDNINYIISDFSEKNRTFGFSFHNKQQNAFNLFYKHYIQYLNKETHIKPFLLVSDNFTIKKEGKLEEIVLEYNYRDIKIYETTINSIGYIVAKYSMGYDFKKLDFICLSDPKLSIQDIKQSIGRGLRPDELGQNGSNKEKILNVSLPVYIDENGDTKYEKILEVLKYLIYDIEIPLKQIEIKNKHKHTPNFKEGEHKSNEYDGENDVKSILLNLLELDNKRILHCTSYEKAKKIIRDKNEERIGKRKYQKLCEGDNRLPPDPEEQFKDKFKSWIDYLSIEKCRYYNLEMCQKKVKEYIDKEPKLKNYYLDPSNICIKLCEKDGSFPPYDLWEEYYDKKLESLISINPKKKQKLFLQ